MDLTQIDPSNVLVLYHGNCNDGFCAAYGAWLYFGDKASYVPMDYGQPVPEVTGRNVFIVDFSFKRPILEEMHAKAESLIVLDHHKTAKADLEGLPYCTFDMGKSGARLTWEYFDLIDAYPDRVWLMDYTEDRDLWLWKLPNSKEVNSGLSSRPLEFEVWNSLVFGEMKADGAAIERYKDQVIAIHLKDAGRIKLGEHTVPIVNATTLGSEIGNILSQDFPYSISWFYDASAGNYRYSLRAQQSGEDVSAVAQKFGGGGHKAAAGFTSKLSPSELEGFFNHTGRPSPTRVLQYLEDITVTCEPPKNREEAEKFWWEIYQLAHIATSKCENPHEDWREEFWKHESGVKESSDKPLPHPFIEMFK